MDKNITLINRLIDVLLKENLLKEIYYTNDLKKKLLKEINDYGIKLQFSSNESLEEKLDYWPKDDSVFDKIKCKLTMFSRVYWFYKDEEDYFTNELGFNIREEPSFSGVIVPGPGIEVSGGELEVDDCLICVDNMPCIKHNPEIHYIALSRLIDNPDFVELFGGKY